MSRTPRVLPDWVQQCSNEHSRKTQQNLKNAANALKQKKTIRQTKHDPNTNCNHDVLQMDINSNTSPICRNKPSTPPPSSRPNSIINALDDLSSDDASPSNNSNQNFKISPKLKPKTNPDAMDIDNDYKSMTLKQLKALCREKGLKVGGNKTVLIQRLKDPTNATHKKQKKKKRKNKNCLMIDTDEDEWSNDSEGTVGSLKDFVITQSIESDEDYDVEEDVNMSNGNMSDFEDGISDTFSSFMSFNTTPPNKRRRGIRTVCNMLPLCQWGKRCYRKNKNHFEEYAHPWKDKK